MKRILSIVLCAAAVAAFGEDTAVTNVAFSIYPVNSTLKNTIVAISLRGLDGERIAVSNLVKTTNLTAGDKLYTFDDGMYEEWTLEESGSWGKVEKKYTMNKTGALVVSDGTDASTVQMSVGSGIWLVRNDQYVEGTSFTFYLYGKPESSPVSTTVAGKWTLIGNPTTGSVTISAKMLQDISQGDEIVLENRKRYTWWDDSTGWITTDENGTLIKANPQPALGAGHGCWMHTKSGATITWTGAN